MKKIFVFALALMSFVTSAQAFDNEPIEGLTFQGLFGMDISNINGKGWRHANPKVGMNFGARGEFVLPECHGVFVNAGLQYVMKGTRPVEDTKVTACYVELPIHVGYRYNVLDDLGVYADFGPYFAIGTNGKMKATSSYVTTSTRWFNKDNFGVKRFDCGLGFRLGAEYADHYSLTFGLDWGLVDMYTNDWHIDNPGLPDAKTFNASIMFGYRF